jgi:hypothetical protein
MEYSEVKQNLCKIVLQKSGLVVVEGNIMTYKTEQIDAITNFVRFKMYDDYVEIFTKNNSYMYSLERIFSLISYKEWKNIRENGDPKHLNTSIPIYYVSQLEEERIAQQNAYNDYQFQNFLNQTK